MLSEPDPPTIDHVTPALPASSVASPSFPLSLKVVATSFLILGLLGVVDVLLAVSDRRVFLDLNVFGLLIGRGLWRLNAAARWWALVALCLGLIALPVAAVIACVAAWHNPYVLAALPLAALLGWFAFWQAKTLTRDDIRRLFVDPALKAAVVRGRSHRRYQFSLASLFVVMLVAALVVQRIRSTRCWTSPGKTLKTSEKAGGVLGMPLADSPKAKEADGKAFGPHPTGWKPIGGCDK